MMLNVSSNGDIFHATRGSICDACRAITCTLYCHTDAAYLCASCDATIHGFNPMKLWHERMSVCMLCDHATAAEKEVMDDHKGNEGLAEKYKDEIDSWLSFNPDNNEEQNNNDGFTNGEVDTYLKLKEEVDANSYFENQYQVQNNPQQCHSSHQWNTGSESLMPLHLAEASEQHQEQWQNFYLGMEHKMSKAGFIHNPSRIKNVPQPFMDAGNVLEATISSTSNTYRRIPKGQFGIHSSTAFLMQPNLTPTNREAKVLRYREKRKARNFEKTIRYASRKAYAETRPRVKGKFARETEMELELDQVFSTAEYAHGIVPSL